MSVEEDQLDRDRLDDHDGDMPELNPEGVYELLVCHAESIHAVTLDGVIACLIRVLALQLSRCRRGTLTCGRALLGRGGSAR